MQNNDNTSLFKKQNKIHTHTQVNRYQINVFNIKTNQLHKICYHTNQRHTRRNAYRFLGIIFCKCSRTASTMSILFSRVVYRKMVKALNNNKKQSINKWVFCQKNFLSKISTVNFALNASAAVQLLTYCLNDISSITIKKDILLKEKRDVHGFASDVIFNIKETNNFFFIKVLKIYLANKKRQNLPG